MLPSQLLRIRTRKGEIVPLFCGSEDKARHLELAKIIINEFQELAANKEKKKILNERISFLESHFDDYRLVRGLSTLLERRCQFNTTISQRDENCGISVNPIDIRRLLWEESARRGFALSESLRDEILCDVASKMNISSNSIMQSLWSDLDENTVLELFSPLSSEELLAWYNLSLLQTLLFTCTRLEFSVRGGANWKNTLRNVKRLGLMYNLREQKNTNESADASNVHRGKSKGYLVHADVKNSGGHESELVCSIDGPVSLFKLTDRYGTSIAKLVPFIVSSSWWYISASIIRKTMSGKKVHEFRISSSDVQQNILSEPLRNDKNGSSNSIKNNSINTNINGRSTSAYFDSSIEEKFAIKFEHLANRWKIKREPDPLIVGNGVAFIPDFLFEKYGRKVYLEIVGFWTKEYLEKKFQKVSEILLNSNVDLFVAVDEELSCSKPFNPSIYGISKNRVIFFRKSLVPIKKLQEYLKSIDKEQIDANMIDSDLKIRFDGIKDVISIEEISDSYKVPIEIATAVASRDNEVDYLRIDSWFVSKAKANRVAERLTGAMKFSEACVILSENSIPEICHAGLISKLGYDVIWQSMDSDDALLAKRN
jgi:predicted nuclease of restriction endonuclease-like RecB superfamily